jgi:hypothetical protein
MAKNISEGLEAIGGGVEKLLTCAHPTASRIPSSGVSRHYCGDCGALKLDYELEWGRPALIVELERIIAEAHLDEVVR